MLTLLFDLSVLTTDVRRTGIGRYVAELGPALAAAARKHTDVEVLGLERLTWTGQPQLTPDVAGAVRRLTSPGTPTEASLSWSCRRRFGLARAARAADPDLVHLGHPGATPFGDLGCPRVVTCHDLSTLHAGDDSMLGGWSRNSWLDHRRFDSADHVIAVSETTANELVTMLGIPARKISVIYNGVDLARWSPEPAEGDAEVRAKHGLADRVYLLHVGGAERRKNPDGMIRALSVARKRAPDLDVVLAWAAGLSDTSRWRLASEARAAGVARGLLLLGYVPDSELAALYRGAAAQLFVSRSEGFGYPVMEAMATGCPVITSNRSSLAEIAGDAALQCDPEDADAIADAIVSVAASFAERARLSARGSDRARRFGLDRTANETLAMYRAVLDHA